MSPCASDHASNTLVTVSLFTPVLSFVTHDPSCAHAPGSPKQGASQGPFNLVNILFFPLGHGAQGNRVITPILNQGTWSSNSFPGP